MTNAEIAARYPGLTEANLQNTFDHLASHPVWGKSAVALLKYAMSHHSGLDVNCNPGPVETAAALKVGLDPVTISIIAAIIGLVLQALGPVLNPMLKNLVNMILTALGLPPLP